METATSVPKYVFSFDEGDGKDKKLLGGKGANLCEMTQIGLNVPPGFVISRWPAWPIWTRTPCPMGSWTRSMRT